jgi:SAM-dependent methyltransferase
MPTLKHFQSGRCGGVAFKSDAMEPAGRSDELEPLLAEQVAYYHAIAAEYEDHGIPGPGGDELVAALDCFRPAGCVLELACGLGVWTAQLLRHATSVTAVDASPEMLAIASARVSDERVRFIQADLFTWAPDRRYDVVFFGFWLSHVPLERFESFWSLVSDCLETNGRVFFVDDGYRTPDELIYGDSSSIIRRRLNDGTSYRAVKRFPTSRNTSNSGLRAWDGGSRLLRRPGRSSGESAPQPEASSWVFIDLGSTTPLPGPRDIAP